MIEPVAAATARWLVRHAPDGPVTVACSGGPDSLALAIAVAGLGRAGRSVTVDHQLQTGSAGQADLTAAVLAGLGFDPIVVPVEVTGPGGLEAAARRARYRALTGAAIGPVLLGHTLDDQAETVLLGLARGSGPRSIAGMAAWTPPWGRPLLGVRRAATEACCAAAGLAPWNDPHNADQRFVRSRLRAEVLPLLEEVLGGGVAPALARTAALMADDLAGLDEISAQVGRAAQRGPDRADSEGPSPGVVQGVDLDVESIVAQPAAVRRRVLRSWVAAIGAGALTADHLQRLDDLITRPVAGAAVRLPAAIDATVLDGRLTARPVTPAVGGTGSAGAGRDRRWQAQG